MANKNFVGKAPAEVVEKERHKLTESKEAMKRLAGVRHGLE